MNNTTCSEWHEAPSKVVAPIFFYFAKHIITVIIIWSQPRIIWSQISQIGRAEGELSRTFAQFLRIKFVFFFNFVATHRKWSS